MKSEREFTGTLLGFDDFVSECVVSLSHISAHKRDVVTDMVLDDVTE